MKKEKWDGRSRPSDDLYRKRFDEIFGSKDNFSKVINFCEKKS